MRSFSYLAGVLPIVLAAGMVVSSTQARGADRLRTCGARKLDRTAETCRRVLRVWAHWQRDGDDGARDRRLARAAARLDRGWERAERRTSACTEATAGTADTVGRLGSAVRAFVDAMTGSPVGEFPGRRVRRCRSRLLRIAGVACGAMIRLEETRLRGRRGRAVAAADRARRRLATAWTAANGGACPTGLDPDEAGAAIARLAAAAAGDATTATLRELAEAAGLHIGAAVEPFPIETDPMYGPTLAGEFTSLSAENRMKWEPIHPEHDRWVFGPADDLVDFAEQHGLQVRAHALVWGRLQLPGYVLDAGSEAELRALMTEHIATVAGRYAGRIAQWDVVNEPLTLNGAPGLSDGLDPNVFWQLLGPGYVEEALRLARAADPGARLYINDFLVLQPGQKQERYYRLAEELLAAGAPLDGVGLQGHIDFVGAPVPLAQVDATVRRFEALGLEVEITELDHLIVDDDPMTLEEQRDVYHDTLLGCFRRPACTGATFWGLTDRYSWLKRFASPDAVPLPIAADYARKPAYFGSRAALIQARTSGRDRGRGDDQHRGQSSWGRDPNQGGRYWEKLPARLAGLNQWHVPQGLVSAFQEMALISMRHRIEFGTTAPPSVGCRRERAVSAQSGNVGCSAPRLAALPWRRQGTHQ